LRNAARPRPLDPVRNEVLVAAALRRGRRARWGAVTAIASALAVAASIALLFKQTQMERSAAPVAAAPHAVLIPSRSTDDLFDAAEPFPRSGGESQRMDRIVGARASDLRANRFAAWGVR
jgi:hypothetical protein